MIVLVRVKVTDSVKNEKKWDFFRLICTPLSTVKHYYNFCKNKNPEMTIVFTLGQE